jgi:hypothetical protein
MTPTLVEELMQEGVEREHIRVYGRHPPKALPVAVTRWRTDNAALVEGAAVGAAAVLLAMLLLGGLSPVAGVLLLLLGAAGGAGWWLLSSRNAVEPVSRQAELLRNGEHVIAADVASDDLERIEKRLSERHPEVPILGPDPAGSPPFP